MPITVLYVCTGNVCRSPMAELLLRSGCAAAAGAAATGATGLRVHSAGLGALVGDPVDTSSAQALRERGIDPDAHRARQFEARMALEADLVLTAERAHRDAVMAEVPSAFRRTFTMREFARLAGHARSAPAAGARAVIAELAGLRGVDGAVPEQADSVADPYRSDLARARATAEQVAATVRATIDTLGLAAAPRAPSRRPSPRPLPHPR